MGKKKKAKSLKKIARRAFKRLSEEEQTAVILRYGDALTWYKCAA